MSLPGLPGDEDPNPQWKLPPEQSKWHSAWTPEQAPAEAPEEEPPFFADAQQAAHQPPPPTPGQAIASLIVSLASLMFFPVVGSIVGLVLGYQAKRRIARSGGALGGRGVALAGIIIGWIGIAIYVGVLVLAVIAGFLVSSAGTVGPP